MDQQTSADWNGRPECPAVLGTEESVVVPLDALMAPTRSREITRNEIDRATEWLRKRLADGPIGSILCAREGDRFLGRRWPELGLPAGERRKCVLGRAKWWRERILKSRLGGASRRAGYNGPYLFRLPGHAGPPAGSAVVEATRADGEELASTDTTASTAPTKPPSAAESAGMPPVEAAEVTGCCGARRDGRWHLAVAGLPLAWRQRWADRAEALQAAGLPKDLAEARAYREAVEEMAAI
jgi:hypothetical protein